MENYIDITILHRETSLYIIETEGQYVRSRSMDCVIFNSTLVFVSDNRKLAHPSRSPMALGSIQQGRHLRKDSKSPNFPYHCRRYGFKTIETKVLETSILSEILGRNFQLGSFAVNTVFPGGTAMVKGVDIIPQTTTVNS